MEVKEFVKEKAAEAKIKLTELELKAQYFYYAHRDECKAAAKALPVVIMGGIGLVDQVSKIRSRKANMRYADRKIRYDPSTGARYQLRRNLSNREELYLDQKRKQGYSVGEILQEMRVLK